MQNQHDRISSQVTEIDRDVNVAGFMFNWLDIDRLVAANTTQSQPIQLPLLAQQGVNHAPIIHRSIPDQLYIPGCIWLGECAVCRNHDNEGFLCVYENTSLTCGHPLCEECANRILTETKSCPNCRRLVQFFLRVRIP